MKNVEHWRKRLTKRLNELEARLGKIEHDLDETPSPDFEERASERENDEVLEGLGSSDLAEIRMIRAALDRMDEGEYGYCVTCGEPIAEERLEIVPHAAKCARCA